jgi:hypothetical protein
MKIRIATPMYGGNCKADYVLSLLDLVSEIAKDGKHTIDYGFVYNESLITRARNFLVDSFLDSDADLLLFIDSDQGFNARDTIKMIESGKDIIGAIVPMKAINWEGAISAHAAGKPQLEPYTGYFNAHIEANIEDFSLLEPVEVRHIGTGMMLVSRKVFTELASHCERYARNDEKTASVNYQAKPIIQYFTTTIDESGVLLSEDYNFCAMWKKLGNKVYAAPWVSVSHSGEYSFRGNFAQAASFISEQPNK